MAKEQVKVTPKQLKYSLAMADVCISEEVADLTLRILERLQELGGNFSLKDACEIRAKWDEALKAFDERFPMSPYCCHEWEPIWDNNSSLTSVKHRCLKCGEIQ